LQGESYVDVVKRLSLLLPALEQQDNLLIVSHQATIR
jgi:broad specificity phosphatase PhoE